MKSITILRKHEASHWKTNQIILQWKKSHKPQIKYPNLFCKAYKLNRTVIKHRTDNIKQVILSLIASFHDSNMVCSNLYVITRMADQISELIVPLYIMIVVREY